MNNLTPEASAENKICQNDWQYLESCISLRRPAPSHSLGGVTINHSLYRILDYDIHHLPYKIQIEAIWATICSLAFSCIQLINIQTSRSSWLCEKRLIVSFADHWYSSCITRSFGAISLSLKFLVHNSLKMKTIPLQLQ